jgi:hypothetical protein
MLATGSCRMGDDAAGIRLDLDWSYARIPSRPTPCGTPDSTSSAWEVGPSRRRRPGVLSDEVGPAGCGRGVAVRARGGLRHLARTRHARAEVASHRITPVSRRPTKSEAPQQERQTNR